MDYSYILDEIRTIVFSGTKLDLSYIVNEMFDDDSQNELYEFLSQSDNDDFSKFFDEFKEDFEEDDLKLYSIHFYCKVAF